MLGGSIWLHCSASSANRVQVRAMSRRISLILGLGAWSAITRHSAARSLQFSAVTMAVPKGTPRINSQKETPPRPGRNQRGVQCSWQVWRLGNQSAVQSAHPATSPSPKPKSPISQVCEQCVGQLSSEERAQLHQIPEKMLKSPG
jgi:hypothetical protein